jgi:hypothetical protein
MGYIALYPIDAIGIKLIWKNFAVCLKIFGLFGKNYGECVGFNMGA